MRYRHWAHWVAGFIIPTSYLLSPVLPPTLAILFIVYEGYQGYRTKDMSYLDIKETMVAAFIATVGLLIWRLIW